MIHVEQVIYYECNICGDMKIIKYEIPLMGQLIIPTKPDGWFRFFNGDYLICPKHHSVTWHWEVGKEMKIETE